MPATAPLRHLKECRKGKCNTGEIPHATLRKSLCIFEEKVLAKNIFRGHPPDHVYHKHHRRAEPPVPEGNKNKECIPERQRAGENAVSGERKCDKEMDAEIPELGPGAQPADSSVSGTSDTVSVKEEKAIKAGTAFYRHKQLFRLCYTDIYSIAGKARFKPEVREMALASVNV